MKDDVLGGVSFVTQIGLLGNIMYLPEHAEKGSARL